MRFLSQILCALLLSPLCTEAHAQWNRILISGKGGLTDTPTPHPLSYFTAKPYLRDDGGDLCLRCLDENGKTLSPQDYQIQAEVQKLGTLSKFEIVEVLYKMRNAQISDDPPAIHWKSILVKTGPNQYREMYHLQALYIPAVLKPAKIFNINGEKILATNDSDGGNGGGCFEGYWWFDASGPHPLDFKPAEAEINKHIPKSTGFTTTCWALDLEHQQINSGVQKINPKCHACDIVGEVTAHIKLNGPHVEATSVEYKETPE